MKIRPTNGSDEPRTLLSRFGFQDTDLKTPQHDEMMLWLDGRYEEIVRGLGDATAYTEISATWEAPIATKDRDGRAAYTVGFVDLWVDCHKVAYRGTDHERSFVERSYLFEVKPAIPSLGELIRQIRFYQQYVHGRFVVVCPDDRFAPMLRKQDIEFVRYEP